MRNRLTRPATAALLAGALVPGTAAASSFQILEQSPSLQGTSFAGTASSAQDASTVFFNPAGMSRLEGREFMVGGSIIQPTADFNDDGSSGLATGPDSTTDESALVPSAYYVMPMNESWTFGFGVNAPFGLSSSYDEDWKGRYHATDSELQLLNINPTFAYRANDRLSVGFGLNYQRIDATLESVVPSGPDSNVKVEGDDDGVGLDLSLHYAMTDQTSIGAVWRQGVDFTLDGTVRFSDPPLPGQDGGIRADVEIPDTLNFSVSHELDDRLSLHGDLAWTEWSSIQEIEIVRDNGNTLDTLDLRYDDTMRYSVGATYSDGGPWTWRGGVAFDEAPQTDPQFVTPRVPDADRTWLSFGFGYAFGPDASLDVGYTHILVDDVEINNTKQFAPGVSSTLDGTFDADVDIIAVSGNWRF